MTPSRKFLDEVKRAASAFNKDLGTLRNLGLDAPVFLAQATQADHDGAALSSALTQEVFALVALFGALLRAPSVSAYDAAAAALRAALLAKLEAAEAPLTPLVKASR